MPAAAQHVRRLWFNGFHVAETDRLILSLVASCPNLTHLTVPWTVVRRGTVQEWVDMLNVETGRGVPLYSLELTAVCLVRYKKEELEQDAMKPEEYLEIYCQNQVCCLQCPGFP